MENNVIRITTLLLSLLLAGMTSVSGANFSDQHSDSVLTNWTVYGNRSWVENNGYASPANYNSNSGFLINNNSCEANGTIEVSINADQWSGHRGGMVFRWTSTTSYYYVAVRPGNQWSGACYIKFCKNTTNTDNGTLIATDFVMNPVFTLKIVMNGGNFSFFVDGVLKGQTFDNDHSSGKIGYAYSSEYDNFINFNSITWTEMSNNLPPSDISLSNNGINERLPVGTDIGSLSTIDPNPGDQHTYSLVSGIGAEDNSLFTIQGNILKTNAVLNYANLPNCSIRIKTTDNGIGNLIKEKIFVINVNEVEDYSTWLHSQTIHMNTTSSGANIIENVSNFPVLVKLENYNFNFNDADQVGNDIRFVASNGTKLPYEIEYWDKIQLKAGIWVLVPLINGNSDQNTITMYWGKIGVSGKSDGTKVFKNTDYFSGVYHLGEEMEGISNQNIYKDVSSSSYNGTDNISAIGQDGSIGNGHQFDGIDDNIQIPTFPHTTNSAITISTWIKPSQQSTWRDLISIQDNNYWNAGFSLRCSNSDQFMFTINNGGKQDLYGTETAFNADGNTWYLVSCIYDGSTMKILINGEERKSISGFHGDIVATENILKIGGRSNADGYNFKGYLDEVRIEKTARSNSWGKLCYENQKENQLFLTVGQAVNNLRMPTNLTSTAIGNSIVLTWSDNTNLETGYEVLYGNDPMNLQTLVILNANTQTYTHQITQCGVSYFYGVRAFNATQTSVTMVLLTPVYNVPCIPSNLSAESVGTTEINLNWNGTSGRYSLQAKKQSQTDWATIYEGPNLTFIDQGLECNNTYQFRVKALNSDQCSGWSNVITTTTSNCGIARPTNLTGDNQIPFQIHLTWTDNATTELGYKVFRKKVGNDGFTEISPNLAENSTEYLDAGLECNSNYTYYVQAFSSLSVSSASEHVNISTSPCGSEKATSQLLNFSGMLLDASNNPITNTKLAIVKIYPSGQTGVTPIYEEYFSNVEVKNGYFSITAGYSEDIVSAVQQYSSLYYDIIIDGASVFNYKYRPVAASAYTIKNTFNLHGEGSPIGNVSAPIGASYVDTQNLLLYMKTGSTDNNWIQIGQ